MAAMKRSRSRLPISRKYLSSEPCLSSKDWQHGTVILLSCETSEVPVVAGSVVFDRVFQKRFKGARNFVVVRAVSGRI
jgi:hypothetical protein